MKIILVRRISQAFFFILFVWLCVVSTIGEKFWQIRGWPVDWFLEMDPLVAIGTMLSTHTLYHPLIWALLIIALTVIFGRFFCGWVCPFGSINHFLGYLFNRKSSLTERVELNRYRKAQNIKYYILIIFLFMALIPFDSSSLQIGLLDPIPLLTRTFNLVLLPLADMNFSLTSTSGRFYDGTWIVFIVFLAAILLNYISPRFYCRYICPLGALFGILSKFAIFRIGQGENNCTNCKKCEKFCEGACNPQNTIRNNECILCFNCREDCSDKVLNYQLIPSTSGEISSPDISRKGFLISLGSGIFLIPAFRLDKQLGSNWHHEIIRPPGSIEEDEFLKRCIKCGQCMRTCPTNVLQPGGFKGGLENLWTPILNNRIGLSGCQLNCVACGQVCPTSAIRPITLNEKHGRGKYKKNGMIKIGTAFFNRGLCLPWAMDKPCIVCQENCPVSPKAIYTDNIFKTIRGGEITVTSFEKNIIEFSGGELIQGNIDSGDYYCLFGKKIQRKILSISGNKLEISAGDKYNLTIGEKIAIQVKLQRPYMDIDRCNGCGICEHECPVSGKRAITVTGAGETRSSSRALLLKRK